MQKIEHALHSIWDAWVKARTEFAKQYVTHHDYME